MAHIIAQTIPAMIDNDNRFILHFLLKMMFMDNCIQHIDTLKDNINRVFHDVTVMSISVLYA